MRFLESSLDDLYKSAVEAFPRTTMRQHATHPIVITELTWTAFMGMKTLFTKGLAQSGGNEYNPMILFKNVNYNGNDVRIISTEGNNYSFSPMSTENTQINLRCNCPDFKWRFNYYNHKDKSLYGRKAAKYEAKGTGPPANPLDMPGMCKHLMKLSKVLYEAGVFHEGL